MSEQKSTLAFPDTPSEIRAGNTKTPGVISQDIMAVSELNPSVNMFSARSNTAISQGTHVNATLKIEACEPDHGYTSAFTVAAAPGTLLAAVGQRPIIDNIRLSAEGRIERNLYECVSPSAMTREVAKVVEQGMSYTEIAEQYGVNKSTIMRRMDALPFAPKSLIRRRAS